MTFYKQRLIATFRENSIAAMKLYFRNASKSHSLPKLSRFINKKLYRLGLGSALNRYDNSLTLYSAKADKKLYSDYELNEKFLNFGSGAFFHNRWKNYDYPGQSSYYRSIQGKEGSNFFAIDLCLEKLAIPESDDSVALIYCSHMLEHLDKESSLRFLKECLRILKKGGVMRVALPNTRNDFYLTRCLINQKEMIGSLYENYVADATSHVLTDTAKLDSEEITGLLDESQFQSDAFYSKTLAKYPEISLFDGNNHDRHINYWEFENLIEATKTIGFRCVVPTYQGSSLALPFTNLHVFDTTEPHISFYADIVK
jgi:SAM-dependent methyltransferase